jgi:GNAT superfamily N-acetyltransferase
MEMAMHEHPQQTIRGARRGDEGLVCAFIRELAEYERLAHECEVTDEKIAEALFGPSPRVYSDIAEVDGVPAGFALWFYNFSTFLARPGIYLEDLFVRPRFRGQGVGKALLVHLARRAVAEGCGRLEWSVLDWNTPSIDFYKLLGALPMNDWTVFRVAGDALSTLAQA